MKKSTVLYAINIDTPDKEIADLAEAALNEQTHLSCLLLGSFPALPYYVYGPMPYGGMTVPDNWGEIVEDTRKAQSNRVKEINEILSRSGVSGDVEAVLCATSDIRHAVSLRARVSDIAHLAPNLRETSDLMHEFMQGVLFQSPIGLMLNRKPPMKPERVFIAWDISDAASHAVHVALPYLKEANEVVIGCFDLVSASGEAGADPGTDLAAWLSHHGCKVTLSQFPSGGREIGQCIQDRAREAGADLVVLGAYGHSRMIEAVLGGTTRTILDQEHLPVLLAH